MGDLVIRVKRRDFWIAFSVLILFVGVGFVISAVDPAVMGHGNIFIDDVNGRVGIGTANPGAKLDVAGNIWVDDISYNGNGDLNINGGTSALRLDIGSPAVTRFYIKGSTGNVGIGTVDPTEKLDVVGNVKASGTVCDGSGNCLDSVGGGGSLDCLYLHDTPPLDPCPGGYIQTGQKPKSSDGHRNYVCCRIV